MRIWHTIFGIFVIALVLTVAREPAGRVAIVVFVAGSAELICGLIAVMMLFQTVGSFGQAKCLLEAVQCLMATALVVTVGAWIMVRMLFIGAGWVDRVV